MIIKRIQGVIFLFIILTLALSACLRPDQSTTPVVPGAPPAAATVPPAAASTAISPTATTVPPELPLYQFVPGGQFTMGSKLDDPLAKEDEFPKHDVRLPGYWIFTNEVTNELYAECVAAGKCTPPATAETGPKSHYNDPAFKSFPVVGVVWSQADAFCKAQDAHLPSEAEWEKAARGFFGNTYPWGSAEADCKLANINGCVKDTAKVATYDDGKSPFEVRDMSGNVREWVSDWYQADAYQTAILFMPNGPETGKMKVVRGGSYLDSARDSRSSARFAYDPEREFDDVGFRCVPNSLNYAPFCSTSYKSPCKPPNSGDTPDSCEPGTLTGEGAKSKVSISCPDANGLGAVQVAVSEPVNGVDVIVNGGGTNCSSGPNTAFECEGPIPAAGTQVIVKVCFVSGITSFNPDFGLHMVSCESFKLVASIGDTITMIETDDNPYFLAGLALIPGKMPHNGGGGGCYEGTTWDPKLQQCVKNTATPIQPLPGTEDTCPEGYVLDPNLLCCIPGTEDNGGCEPGYYHSLAADLCIPVQENGCPAGWTYDPYLGCMQPIHQGEEPKGCPPGTHLLPDGKTCASDQPEDVGDITCPPGSEYVPGKGCETSVSESQITIFECNDGYYYDSKAQGCVQLTQDGCMAGTYFDPDLKQCLPTTGPWTGCPQNYVLNVKTGCCVPVPGTDNTDCIGGTTKQGPTPVPGTPNNQNSWDPGSSNCPPPIEDACPPGYILSEAGDVCLIIDDCPPGTGPTPNNPNGCFPQGNEPCPQGYKMTDTGQGCVSTVMITHIVCDPGYHSNDNATECLPDEGCPPGTGPTPNNPNGCHPQGNEPCPQGYEMSSTGQGCVLIKNDGVQYQCAPSQYWDPIMGMCLDRTDDCCAQGYYYDLQFKQCLPFPVDQNCPPGYDFDGKACIPFVQQGANCTSTNLTIPACIEGCPNGTHWDKDQQRCLDDNPCQGVRCGKYGDEKSCEVNRCCQWSVPVTGGPGTCVRK